MKLKDYRLYYRVYAFLNGNWLTRALLARVRNRYEMLCPAKESYIVTRCVQTILLTWLVISVEIIGVIRLSPGFVQTGIAVMIAVILHHEILQASIHHMEEKLLKQLEQFITDVRHHYYVSRMVDDAIFDAMDHTPYEMRVHALKFYEIVTSDHCEELADQYHMSSHNNFLNLFLALCVTVVEYGDRTVQDQSLFLMNLANLKTEVNLELLKVKQINYLYSGLSFVVVVPVTLLKVIERWGVSNLPELASFYEGRLGAITMLIIILATLLLYIIVSDLKEYRRNLPKDYLFVNQALRKKWVEKAMENFKKQCPKLITRIRKLIDESGEVVQVQQVLLMRFLYGIVGFGGCTVFSVYYVIHDQERYDWYELVIAAVVGYLCFCIPEWRLMFHRAIAAMGREDEIIRYQSIVLMLMYIERISVLEILERIEEFSLIFRKPIQTCINDYNASDQDALEHLKEETAFLPFQRFVDNLLISDEIGIEKAFDEVAADRQHFQEKRKQENEMNLNKRFELARFLAYIPAILVIGGYLILPFLIECYHQLSLYQEMMKTMMY